jgi:hypothetical protein
VTLGIALGGSVQIGLLAFHLRRRLPNDQYKNDVSRLSSSTTIETPRGADVQIINAVLHSKAAIRQLPMPAQKIALDVYAKSLSTVWIGCAGVSCLTLLSAWFIQEKEMGPVKPRGRGRKGRAAEGQQPDDLAVGA